MITDTQKNADDDGACNGLIVIATEHYRKIRIHMLFYGWNIEWERERETDGNGSNPKSQLQLTSQSWVFTKKNIVNRTTEHHCISEDGSPSSNQVLCVTRGCNRRTSLLLTISSEWNSVACWKNEMSGYSHRTPLRIAIKMFLKDVRCATWTFRTTAQRMIRCDWLVCTRPLTRQWNKIN